MRKASRVLEHPEAVIDSLFENLSMSEILPTVGQAHKRGSGATGAAGAPGHRLGQAPTGSKSRPLGIYAKSVHALGAAEASSGFSPMAARVQRFALQSVARQVLPESRTAKCLRWRAHKQDVKVWKSHEHKTAHYSGLQTCSSVWTCPVCAAKIAERRRAEVLGAMSVHQAGGGNVHLLTVTVPHQRGDNLVTLLEQQKEALRRFWNDREVKAVLAEMGYLGQIRATEVTHGRKSPRNNGWHPHYHVLLFTGSGVDLARFDKAQRRDWEVRLYMVWARVCKAAGLGLPSIAHGLKLDAGDKASQYMTKWGLEHELTYGHIKKGKTGGETPFDLLRSLLADPGDKQAAALFREYAEAFKGKRQLFWSHGLKARFAVAESTDEELAQRIEEGAELLGQITPQQWRDVLKVEARATVLEIAAKRSWHHVERFLWLIEGAHTGTPIPPDVLSEARTLLLE